MAEAAGNTAYEVCRMHCGIFTKVEKIHMEDIFPILGKWNLIVDTILKKEYPPRESSKNISFKEIERDKNMNFTFSKIPTWELISEEAVDTEHSHIYYTKIYSEILSRGISHDEYTIARKFMWLTSGWLNFELMLWNWVQLGEEDIKKAIEIQYKENMISKEKKERMHKYINKINGIRP